MDGNEIISQVTDIIFSYSHVSVSSTFDIELYPFSEGYTAMFSDHITLPSPDVNPPHNHLIYKILPHKIKFYSICNPPITKSNTKKNKLKH